MEFTYSADGTYASARFGQRKVVTINVFAVNDQDYIHIKDLKNNTRVSLTRHEFDVLVGQYSLILDGWRLLREKPQSTFMDPPPVPQAPTATAVAPIQSTAQAIGGHHQYYPQSAHGSQWTAGGEWDDLCRPWEALHIHAVQPGTSSSSTNTDEDYKNPAKSKKRKMK